MTMKNAIRIKMCEAEKKFETGCVQCCCTMYGIVEFAMNDTVKSTMMITGSTRKPTMRVRLAPIAP